MFDQVLITALSAAAAWVVSDKILGWPSFLVKVAACGAGILGFLFAGRYTGSRNVFRRLRGRSMITSRQARHEADHLRQDGDTGILWGGMRISANVARKHFFVVGGTGSGKTMTHNMVLKCSLAEVGTGKGHRALVYDPKREEYGTLKAILKDRGNSAPRIVLLNPFDERSAAWDVAADITTKAQAQHLAATLVPEEKGSSQPYFAETARHLLSGVMIALMRTRGQDWTFADVMCALRNKEVLRRALLSCPDTEHLVGAHLDRADTFKDVFSTMASKLQDLETIAALWSHATHKVSLREWLTGSEEFILVLGQDEEAETALHAVNRVMFRRIVEILLNQPDSPPDGGPRCWFFLDEVQMAGHLEKLAQLMVKGRSKGACVVLGFQDIEGMEEAYGEKMAHVIVGMCTTKAYLRTESERTADWASRTLGEVEEFISTTSHTRPRQFLGGAGSTTTAEQLMTRRAVLPSEFLTLPPASLKDGLTGYYDTAGIGAFRHWYPPAHLAASLPVGENDPDDGNYKPRPAEYQFLSCDGDGDGPGTAGPSPGEVTQEGEQPRGDAAGGKGAAPEPRDPLGGVSRSRR